MKLKFTGGLWDGVEFESSTAPKDVRLGGVYVDDTDEDLPPSSRKTVLMSRTANDVYELDRFDGVREDVAVYVLKES